MRGAGQQLGLTVGIVIKRDDPLKLGRVRLRLPEYADTETDWTRVTMPFAGKTQSGAHGGHSVPEEGDEVVVGLHQGDPKHLVVLGSVYSKERKPPTEKPDERVFVTKKKNLVMFSDVDGEERIHLETPENSITISKANKSVTLKTKGGPQVELLANGNKVSISANGGPEIVLEGTPGSVTIKAKSVVVEAPSIQLKGKVDVTG